LHSVLDVKPSPTLPEADRKNLNHLRAFYDACLDEDKLDRISLKPLVDIVQPMLDTWRGKHSSSSSLWPPWLPPIPPLPPPEHDGDKKKRPADRAKRMTDTLLYLHSRSVPVLWASYLEGDVKLDPQTRRVWLQQADLGLPDPAYYDDKDTLAVYREVVRSSLASVYDSLDGKEAAEKRPFGELAHDIVDLEKRMAKIMLSVCVALCALACACLEATPCAQRRP
jgi:hypothetical protein